MEEMEEMEEEDEENEEYEKEKNENKAALDSNEGSHEMLIWMHVFIPNMTRIRDCFENPKRSRSRRFRWLCFIEECIMQK